MVSVATKSHVSRNTLFFRTEKEVQLLRAHKQWPKFHRMCGMQRLYFDDFEKLGAKKYTVLSYMLKDADLSGRTISLPRGEGESMIDALADAYIKSNIAVEGAEQLLLEMQNAHLQKTNVSALTPSSGATARVPANITDDEDLIG